jgi:hypothetical protein
MSIRLAQGCAVGTVTERGGSAFRFALLGDCGERRRFLASRYAQLADDMSEQIPLLRQSVGASNFFTNDVVRDLWERLQAHPWLGAPGRSRPFRRRRISLSRSISLM